MAKTADGERKEKELKDTIHAPVQRQPHANGSRTQVKSSILDRRRPHKRKVRIQYTIEEREHRVIGKRNDDWPREHRTQW